MSKGRRWTRVGESLASTPVVRACRAVAEDLSVLEPRGTTRKAWALAMHSGVQLLALHRLAHACAESRSLRPASHLVRWVEQRAFGCDIHPDADIGKALRFPHPTGVVIGAGSIVGDECSIYQHVTLGSHGRAGEAKAYPKLDRGVTIYPGAVVVGAVKLG